MILHQEMALEADLDLEAEKEKMIVRKNTEEDLIQGLIV
jgi:hypothetical protein